MPVYLNKLFNAKLSIASLKIKKITAFGFFLKKFDSLLTQVDQEI